MQVFICMIVLALAIQDGLANYRYPDLATLKNDSMYICCTSYVGKTWGRRNNKRLKISSVPSRILVREQAVPYNKWRASDATGLHSGILNECCMETCGLEEVNEGYGVKPDEYGEECIHESAGCSYEEMAEHCP